MTLAKALFEMAEPKAPKINKWPFVAGDALLLWTACFIYAQSKIPMGATELCLAVGCIALGAALAIVPFVLEYQGLVRVLETGELVSTLAQIKELEKIAAQIGGATARWQNVQDEADKTAAAAKSIAEKMAAEVKAFTEFMQRVNDSEKSTLRLEVEKLRRSEQDWLQALVRMMDHVHALHSGAVRSGQPNLIEQMTNFQNACRDAARRVGLVPFVPAGAEAFDAERHEVFEGNGKPEVGAKIAETVASGYTFQGRMLRPALVRLQDHVGGAAQPQAIPAQTGQP